MKRLVAAPVDFLPAYVSMVDHTTAQMSDRGSEEFIICSGKLQRYNCI